MAGACDVVEGVPLGSVADVAERVDVVVDGVHLVCQVTGPREAPPVVLLHALGERASTWEYVMAGLATAFRVVAVDLRGHGDSGWPGRYSFEAMRDDVLGVLDQMRLTRVSVVGHSMGGVVAYLLAAEQPERVERLVVEDVPPPFRRGASLRDRPPGDLPFDWDVVPAIVEQIDNPDPGWWDLLPRITAPTLIVGGGATSHIPQDKLIDVVARLSDATLVTIPVGHHVHAARPADFTAAVLDFLQQ